jgi:tRNA threonylcarbamoyladenosine biosynthesis protein TsaE
MQPIIIKDISNIKEAAKLFIEKVLPDFFDSKNKEKLGICIAFYGEMGVGKTTFIKAICEELGVVDIVTSPSFALINEYRTIEDKVIYHFDFYRINSIEEVFDFGYEDYFFSNNYCLIEWPEKIESILPENCITVRIEENFDNSRTLIIAD